MADQETREEAGTESTDAPQETSQETPEETSEDRSSEETSEQTSEQTSERTSERTSEQASGEGSSGDDAGETPARRSDTHAKPQQLTDSDREAQEANRRSFVGGGRGGTEERAPEGESRRGSVDVGELVWKVASVLATVIRVVTLVFAVVLVVHIALVVVGVNPVNGVASFLGGFADAVVLGFRDLFQPVDPTIALVVNYGVAAVFWVVVGGFVSAGIRFLAARVS